MACTECGPEWRFSRIPLATRMTKHEADHERYIRRCIELAQHAILTDDTPVGSLDRPR